MQRFLLLTPRRILKYLLRSLANALIRSSTVLAAEVHKLVWASPLLSQSLTSAIMANPSISAKFYPYAPNDVSFILPKTNQEQLSFDNLGLPIPPLGMWRGYGPTAENYLYSGKRDFDLMAEILGKTSFSIDTCSRVLDFGCAEGRMLRHWHDRVQTCEIWGVDINAQIIIWCQQHLSPPFNFATVTTFPHLPFEDGYFDLIQCGSVFTHIPDLADAWLLELRRILNPKGRLYVTVHDNYTIELLRKKFTEHPVTQGLLQFDEDSHVIQNGFSMFTIWRTSDSQVYYDIDYLRQHWGRMMQILSVTEEAYGYQTALVLAKK